MNPPEEPNPPPAPGKTIALSFQGEEQPGERIGRYKILQKIGEGGCGVVYMAEQQEPVTRRVALKVIKLGMDTKQVIARFEAERQALALMDHPNIAKVLDAGATETGRPFFVMELVRGIKITEYCDQNKLPTSERLRLFIQVCNAIQHAHQKGIIHRDIKPSNILVTLHDGVPIPKVIDFGIAKATQGKLTDETLFTAFEQFIGTPAYMSPEQAEMSGLDIDTRSDIYALGVLMYELLTGRTPFEAKELIESGLDQLRRTIREKEPERPSTRLGTMLAAELDTVAQRRRLEAPKLIHLLRGDLDWIVMKTLEKDRTRRYETANALAQDVERYLTNEPVLARPPSRIYRFQKMARRNQTAFFAIGAGLTALIIGLALSLYLFVRERAAVQEEARLRIKAERAATLEAQLRMNAEVGSQVGEAAFYLTQGRVQEAEIAINKVPVGKLPALISHYPATAAIFQAVGGEHARHGEWSAAVSNYSTVIQCMPADFQGYHLLTPLLLQAGDQPGYEQMRNRLLEQFGTNTDASMVSKISKDCLIVPASGTVLSRACALVDGLLDTDAANASSSEVQAAKALADYRRGNFSSAAEWARKAATERKPQNRNVQARMLFAMSQYKLDKTDDARATLKEGLETADRTMDKLPGRLDEDWNNWIIAHALMREAQTLIGAPPARPADGNK